MVDAKRDGDAQGREFNERNQFDRRHQISFLETCFPR